MKKFSVKGFYANKNVIFLVIILSIVFILFYFKFPVPVLTQFKENAVKNNLKDILPYFKLDKVKYESGRSCEIFCSNYSHYRLTYINTINDRLLIDYALNDNEAPVFSMTKIAKIKNKFSDYFSFVDNKESFFRATKAYPGSLVIKPFANMPTIITPSYIEKFEDPVKKQYRFHWGHYVDKIKPFLIREGIEDKFIKCQNADACSFPQEDRSFLEPTDFLTSNNIKNYIWLSSSSPILMYYDDVEHEWLYVDKAGI